MLAPDEPPPFESIGGGGAPPIVIVCDHASNRVPRELSSLGLEAEHMETHIAWDIGAGAVARSLAVRCRANAIIAGYSRLVVDLNRAPEDVSAYPSISDGRLIPGNVGLTLAAKTERRHVLFDPYHAAIDAAISARTTVDLAPVCLGLHSFTPQFHGTWRPWEIGILWDTDPRVALPLMARLRASGCVVGDNEPYSGRHPADYSMDIHAEARGLAHVGIEIRQDLIADEPGQARWAQIVGDALLPVLEDPRLYLPRV
jgi:predicted N-formylglutamate amidohydrolase